MSPDPSPLPISDPDELGFCPGRLSRIDSFVSDSVSAGAVPGAALLIARSGKIAYQAIAGTQHCGTNRPMNWDTVYRIASMSKPVTSLAVMMLYEEGRFRLEDPISQYIPEFAEPLVFTDEGQTIPARREISIRHLLTHTSGISYGGTERHRTLAEAAGLTGHPIPVTTGELVRGIARMPLVHHPGDAWTYGASVIVLGHLVEVLSGSRFDSFLEERIFGPLGMSDTAFFVPPEKRERLMPIHEQGKNGLVALSDSLMGMRMFDLSTDYCTTEPQKCHLGGEGLTSTIYDYTRFAQMQLNGGILDVTRLLGRKTADRMATNSIGDLNVTVATELQGDKMGLGVGIRVDRGMMGGLESVGSYGWGGAFTTAYWVDPAEDLIGVIMSQFRPSNVDFMNKLRNLVYQALV